MKRCTLMLALLLVATAAYAETLPTGSPATTDRVALNFCEEPAQAAQGTATSGLLPARQQGLTPLEGAPLPAEELNAVHGRYLLGGAPLQPSLQRSDVKLWDEGRAVVRSQQTQ